MREFPDPRPWWWRWLCWGECLCRPYADEGGCGGQCIRCGRIIGYVTRAELRAYADRCVPLVIVLILGSVACTSIALAQLGQLPIYVVPSPSGVPPPTFTSCGMRILLGSVTSQPLSVSLGNISGGQTVLLAQGC